MDEIRAQEIIKFWLGGISRSTLQNARFEMWFGKDDGLDRQISKTFSDDIERACRGERDHWMAEPASCLALIILTDQFTRNARRNTPQAFACDGKARQACLAGMEKGFDRKLPLFARLFFYLPLEHSENLEDQERSLELFRNLLADAPAELAETFREVLDYARRHREIIARFGRFPHRNEILGRVSTTEEIEFLKQPGSGF